MPETSKKPPEKKLLDQVRDAIRTRHYSIRTEEAYVNWVRRFILFHGKRHPKDMGGAEIEAFLTHLAVEGHVAASTQNQALSARLFLYRPVLHQELDYPMRPPPICQTRPIRAGTPRQDRMRGLPIWTIARMSAPAAGRAPVDDGMPAGPPPAARHATCGRSRAAAAIRSASRPHLRMKLINSLALASVPSPGRTS